jgi:hypothetical protein
VISEEPNGSHDNTIELSDADTEHIRSCIRRGLTEGEVVQDEHELTWESAGTDEPGDQHADSTRRVGPGSTSAYYSLGPPFATPSAEDGERWSVELIQVSHSDEIDTTSLGTHPDEPTAKAAAQQHENGRP